MNTVRLVVGVVMLLGLAIGVAECRSLDKDATSALNILKTGRGTRSAHNGRLPRVANADPHPRGTQPGCGMMRRGRGSALGDLSARRPFEGRRRKGRLQRGWRRPSTGRALYTLLLPCLFCV